MCRGRSCSWTRRARRRRQRRVLQGIIHLGAGCKRQRTCIQCASQLSLAEAGVAGAAQTVGQHNRREMTPAWQRAQRAHAQPCLPCSCLCEREGGSAPRRRRVRALVLCLRLGGAKAQGGRGQQGGGALLPWGGSRCTCMDNACARPCPLLPWLQERAPLLQNCGGAGTGYRGAPKGLGRSAGEAPAAPSAGPAGRRR